MSDEQLIELVKRHPVLYDSKVSQYRDIGSRTAAWEKIAALLHSSHYDCRTRWAKLRNCYTNSRKRRMRKSNLAPWKFENEMGFLSPHIELKETDFTDEELPTQFIEEKPIFIGDSDDSNTSPRRDDVKNDATNVLEDMVGYILEPPKQIKREIPEMDENDYFFLAMSKQLKRLPRKEQLDIKFQLHKLIHDTEMKYYSKTPVIAKCEE